MITKFNDYIKENYLIEEKFLSSETLQKYKDILIKKLKYFWDGVRQEKEEYKEILPFIKKYMKGEELTDIEKKKLNQQILDTLKLPMNIGFLLVPGGGIALTGLIWLTKKYGLNMLPSAFAEKTEEVPQN